MADFTLSVADCIDQFRQAMAEDGLVYDGEIVPDGGLHRIDLRGDKPGRENGWYILHNDSMGIHATYGCHKRYTGQQLQWSPKGARVSISPEERARIDAQIARVQAERAEAEKKRQAKAKARAEIIWNKSVPCVEHEYLTEKCIKPFQVKVGVWEVWDKDAREYVILSRNALIIPVRDRNGLLHSLQAIIPKSDLPEGDENAKKLLPGGAKKGLFCAIGAKRAENGRNVFILCEGYATGASIHEATGHAVLVCFDSGNLPTVAELLAEGLNASDPDALVIIAADNDQWTKGNPGLTKAREAALKVGGQVACPEFKSNVNKPTDFNDLHAREGLEAVTLAFKRIIDPAAVVEPAPEESVVDEPLNAQVDPGIVPDCFAILGYTADAFVFYQHEQKQVKFIGQTNFTESTLLNLAPLEWWASNFPAAKGNFDKSDAVNWINRVASRRGFFDARRIRGRGAWADNSRVVFHHGDRLTVSGVQYDLSHIESEFIYPRRPDMPRIHPEALHDFEGCMLLKIARKLAWSRPASAPMLLGWAFLAPLCGALKWRPHIWITGGAGSGKTTVMNDFLLPMIDGFCHFVQGASTEAGIRQELGSDAMPVLMDEAETNNKRETTRMESILALVRQASSETQARTLRGSASGNSVQYLIRSMFALSSINTHLQKQADSDRLTRLELLPANARTGTVAWEELSDDFHMVRTMENLSARIVARATSMFGIVAKTIDIFRRIGSAFFESQRKADQYGTLMAGCWCATHNDAPTDEQCEQMLSEYDWNEHIHADQGDDAQAALDVVMTLPVKTKFGDYQVQQLLKGLLFESPLMERATCYEALIASGFRMDKRNEYLCICTDHPVLTKLIGDHPFAHDLRGQLKRIKGADVNENKNMRFGAISKKVVRIPLTTFEFD
ncbi:toprim domain-containing protein [Salmonella enterica subsp. enterica serovar Mississippi]|nr:toprim domain-containing protein [Salmonella enterica subsp. enterica serovar Mississippi]